MRRHCRRIIREGSTSSPDRRQPGRTHWAGKGGLVTRSRSLSPVSNNDRCKRKGPLRLIGRVPPADHRIGVSQHVRRAAILMTAACLLTGVRSGEAGATHSERNKPVGPFGRLLPSVLRIIGLPSTTTSPENSTGATPSTTSPPAGRQRVADAPSGAPTDPAIRCERERSAVELTGLVLPGGFEYRCPGSTHLFIGDRQHWGTICAYASLCPRSAYVAINPAVIGPNDARLRYVIAHEFCHARDYQARRPVRESTADACAAAHGFGPI